VTNSGTGREWYFLAAGTQAGPISQGKLEEMHQAGLVTKQTPVWTEGLSTWVPYGAIPADLPDAGLGSFQTCSCCGRLFSTDNLLDFRSHRVCAECKPVYLQRLKEGLPPLFASSSAVDGNRAGFWIRAGAKMIDWFILWIFNSAASFVAMLAFLGKAGRLLKPEDPDFLPLFLALYGILFAVQFGSAALYYTWMVGRYGATVGKMACGLRITTPFGQPGYGRALGRYAAEIVSGMMLGIGYLMVAFDPERRALHDRMCNTWVIIV
jgi:uncharacterized RDD family membrane protein YckC